MFGGGSNGFKEGEKVWNEIMNQVDADGDGVISYDEFKTVMFDIIVKSGTATRN